MTPRLPVAIAVIALVSTGIASTTLIANAQQDEVVAHRFVPSPEDRAAFLEARIAALHAGLELTADQEKLWPPVAEALRDFGKLVAEQRQKFHDAKQPLDPIERLQMRSDNMIARGQALKKVADAASPLYAALSDAQKRRLPILARAIFHPFHPHGMMGGWRRGMMGGGMMGGGMMGGPMGGPMMGDDHPDEVGPGGQDEN